MTIRVLLVDDHELVRRALGRYIDGQDGMLVVGEASDGRGAIRLAEQLGPNVVVMDVSMPGLNGIEAARQITTAAPGIRVLALSAHMDQRHVSAMLEAGAYGYLAKDSGSEEFVRAIRSVHAGSVYLGPGVTNVVVDDYLQRLDSGSRSLVSLLSNREREVLQLIAEGKNTKEIAHLFGVSHKTIDSHRANIMSKIGIRTVAELTKYAIREGLTTLD